MPDNSTTTESEIRALAHRHLGDDDGPPVKLLRRLDDHMQSQERLLSLYKEKEHLTETVAELLKSGATTGVQHEVESMVNQASK